MKHNSLHQIGGGYFSPVIDIYEMPAENGFAGSVETAGISDWGEDGETLQF